VVPEKQSLFWQLCHNRWFQKWQGSKPDNNLSNVVLPQPLFPTIQVKLFSEKVKSTVLSAIISFPEMV
jgi:hypothetical protein